MPTTTIKVENSTLAKFRQKRIEHEYKNKIILKNDDGFLLVLLGMKKWQQKQNKQIWTQY